MIYFWKTRSSLINRPLSWLNVESNGRRDADIERSAVTFTKHGIVYSYAKKHNDRIFASETEDLNYFTYYYMVYNGRLWKGKSWGGTLGGAAVNGRSKRFAEDAVRLALEETNEEPAPPSINSVNERDLAQLREVANGLIELILSWISSTFPRMGIVWSCWEDYPVALRDAMTLLDKQGGEQG